MRRRDFIAGLGCAGTWPLSGRAQPERIPVIGFLAAGSNDAKRWGASFPQGLKEAGYVEGQNLAIEYRGGPPRLDRLFELATELVRRQVAVILTANDGPAVAAKRATSTIPIVFFAIGSDPVTLGLVASINRPGGNVTGASFDSPQLVAKGFDLLCHVVPTAETVAYLTNGASLLSFEETKNSLVAAAGALGRQLIIVERPTNEELGHSFATIVERGAGAVIAGPLFGVNADAIVSLAVRHKIPLSGFPSRGGLMSYGVDFADQIRIAAVSPMAEPRQFALTIAVRSWWLCGLRKAEPVEEHKESGIILDLTRCGQRLNNRAAILQSKKSVMGTGVTPAEESAGAGGAIVEAASQRVTRLGVVLARRPPSASPSSRSMPEPNTGDRNSHGSGVEEFRTAKLRRGSPDVCPGPGCGEDDRRLLRFSNGF